MGPKEAEAHTPSLKIYGKAGISWIHAIGSVLRLMAQIIAGLPQFPIIPLSSLSKPFYIWFQVYYLLPLSIPPGYHDEIRATSRFSTPFQGVENTDF